MDSSDIWQHDDTYLIDDTYCFQNWKKIKIGDFMAILRIFFSSIAHWCVHFTMDLRADGMDSSDLLLHGNTYLLGDVYCFTMEKK